MLTIVILLLGSTHTHSCRVLTKTALLNQQVRMNSYKSYTILIKKRFAYAAVRNHRVVDKSIYHRHLWKQANTLQNFACQCFFCCCFFTFITLGNNVSQDVLFQHLCYLINLHALTSKNSSDQCHNLIDKRHRHPSQ